MVLFGCEIWFLTLMEEHRLRVWIPFLFCGGSCTVPLNSALTMSNPRNIRFHLKRRQNPVSETLCVLNKNRTMDNVQKHSDCINILFSVDAASC
jgi:hypothetical protein